MSFGNYPFGNFAFGNFAFGNFALGNFALGNLAFGNLAFGNLAFGNLAFGNLAFGNLVFDINSWIPFEHVFLRLLPKPFTKTIPSQEFFFLPRTRHHKENLIAGLFIFLLN
jgi:hypothetical protein